MWRIALVIPVVVTALTANTASKEPIKMKKLTPILVVDQIEPSLAFWVDRLGFEVEVQVPAGDGLAFAIVRQGDMEIMLQTRSSVADDMPTVAKQIGRHGTCLYVEVESIDATIEKLDGLDVFMPKRKAFYGAIEIGFREPGGHFVTFAEPATAPADE